MKSQVFGAMLLGVALLAGPAHAGLVTINFDGPAFNNFVPVTNQFTDVTFSSSGGDIVMITAQAAANPLVPPYLSSAPNLICTGTPAALPSTQAVFDCTHDLILTFATPVDNLSFTAYGDQTVAPGTFAQADIFFAAAPTMFNVPLNVSHTVHCGDPTKDCEGDPQSLAFTGISKVVIHNNTDTAGTAYDDFSFTYAGGVDAPEPSTLVLTGLCGIFWTGRRFLARKSRKNS